MLLNLIYHAGSKQTDPYIESVFDRFRRSFSTKIDQSVFENKKQIDPTLPWNLFLNQKK